MEDCAAVWKKQSSREDIFPTRLVLTMSSMMSAMASSVVPGPAAALVVSSCRFPVVMAMVTDTVLIPVHEVVTDSVAVRIRVTVVITDTVAVFIRKAVFPAITVREALACRTSADGTCGCCKCRNGYG